MNASALFRTVISCALGMAALLVAPGAEAQTYCQSYDDEPLTGSPSDPTDPTSPPVDYHNSPFWKWAGAPPAFDAAWGLEQNSLGGGTQFAIAPFPGTGSPSVQFTLHGATGPVYVVDLLPYIYASFIPTAPSRIVFDLAVITKA